MVAFLHVNDGYLVLRAHNMSTHFESPRMLFDPRPMYTYTMMGTNHRGWTATIFTPPYHGGRKQLRNEGQKVLQHECEHHPWGPEQTKTHGFFMDLFVTSPQSQTEWMQYGTMPSNLSPETYSIIQAGNGQSPVTVTVLNCGIRHLRPFTRECSTMLNMFSHGQTCYELSKSHIYLFVRMPSMSGKTSIPTNTKIGRT